MSVLKEKINGIVDKIGSIPGVQSCALISRDGVLLGKKASYEFNEAWFSAMCATILASAESVAVIMKAEAPRHITIQTPDGSIVIIGSGDKLFIAAYVDKNIESDETYETFCEVAEEIAGSF